MTGKRIFDMFSSACLLALLSPLLIIIGVCVWLESGPPILFKQIRIGRRFQPFLIYKFRSMRNDPLGSRITVKGDNRVTKIGRILRASKFDELPQLWNVLRGDMSMVGPRPELPEYVELYKQRYQNILELRPGITDLASLEFDNEEAILASAADPQCEYINNVLPRKLELAERYLRERSAFRDYSILLKTVLVPLTAHKS